MVNLSYCTNSADRGPYIYLGGNSSALTSGRSSLRPSRPSHLGSNSSASAEKTKSVFEKIVCNAKKVAKAARNIILIVVDVALQILTCVTFTLEELCKKAESLVRRCAVKDTAIEGFQEKGYTPQRMLDGLIEKNTYQKMRNCAYKQVRLGLFQVFTGLESTYAGEFAQFIRKCLGTSQEVNSSSTCGKSPKFSTELSSDSEDDE